MLKKKGGVGLGRLIIASHVVADFFLKRIVIKAKAKLNNVSNGQLT